MIGTERQLQILDYMRKHEAISVRQVVEKFYVSEATARRDLSALERTGLVRRIFGGATLVIGSEQQVPLFVRQQENQQEKAQLCEKAAEYIKDGDVIFIDASSTTQHLLPYLKKFKDLVVITNGITTAQEALIKKEMVPLMKPLIGSSEFWLDVMGFVDAAGRDEVLSGLGMAPGERSGHLKIKGAKVLLDGSPQGGTAWMEEPYEDGHNGEATTDPHDLRRFLREAADAGMQVAVHCNGDAACRALVEAAEEVASESGSENRVVMVHSQFLTPDLMDRMKAIGMEPSFFVSHTWYWGDLYVELFGKDRADRMSPCRTALEMGMRVTVHQDTPVLDPWPMDAVYCAVNRITEGGDVRGESERIGIEGALRAVTVDAAGQNGEDRIGRIAPGCRADLIVLDRDPRACPPEDLRQVRVLETIKGGVSVYRV